MTRCHGCGSLTLPLNKRGSVPSVPQDLHGKTSTAREAGRDVAEQVCMEAFTVRPYYSEKGIEIYCGNCPRFCRGWTAPLAALQTRHMGRIETAAGMGMGGQGSRWIWKWREAGSLKHMKANGIKNRPMRQHWTSAARGRRWNYHLGWEPTFSGSLPPKLENGWCGDKCQTMPVFSAWQSSAWTNLSRWNVALICCV